LRRIGLTVADLFDTPLDSNQTGRRRSTNGLVSFSSNSSRAKQTSSAPQPTPTAERIDYWRELLPPKDHTHVKPDAQTLSRRLTSTFDYVNLDGSANGKVLRYDLVDQTGQVIGKTFAQKVFNTETRRWRKGKPTVLYNLPAVTEAINADELVYLVEGEKDVETLRQHGVVATTNAGGAEALNASLIEPLRNARVVLAVDHDKAGYRRGVKVARLLFGETPIVRELRIVRGRVDEYKADITDHLNAGHSLDELIDVDPELELAAIEAAEREREALSPTESGNVTPQQQERDPSPAPPEADASIGSQKPRWSISITGGEWAYSTGDDADGIPRGVYRNDSKRGWVKEAPLPYVLERLIRRDGQGRRSGVSYRLAMRKLDLAGDVVICSDAELRDGSWAELLDVPLSADDKIIKAAATAVRHTARQHAEAHEISPRWIDGTLHIPHADVIEGGYVDKAGNEETARQRWQAIAPIVARSPKVAFTMGATIAGLFVQPLREPYRSFWVQLTGKAQHGKSTAMRISAMLLGEPGTIIETFNASDKAFTYRFGELSCLPVFLDELGSGELKDPIAREKLILSSSEGAMRRVADRSKRTTKSPRWDSTLICSGNEPITDGITNEAVFARVIELQAPITTSAVDCDTLKVFTKEDVYGWPLHWLRQQLDLDRFASRVAAAEEQMDMPDGGVALTLARNLAMAVAGAAELDNVLGTDCLLPAATQQAQAVLVDQIAELRERGATPGVRLFNAVVQAIFSEMQSFPTRGWYRAANGYGTAEGDASYRATQQLPREVKGFMIDEDPDIEGDVAVLHDKLPAIAAAAGIKEPRTGLRELAQAGILVRSTGDKDPRLQRKIRVLPRNRYKPSCYVFKLDSDLLARLRGDDTGDSPTETGDTTDRPSTSTDEVDLATGERQELLTATPNVPEAHSNTGDSGHEALTRTDAASDTPSSSIVPSVPGSNHHGHARARDHGGEWAKQILGEGTAGPFWLAQRNEPRPCRLCGKGEPVTDDRLGPVHPVCAMTPPQIDEAMSGDAEKSTSEAGKESDDGLTRLPAIDVGGPKPNPPKGFTAVCAVIDPTGIYLPDGARYALPEITDALDILELGERLQLGHPAGLGQLVLTDAMCVELNLVAEASPSKSGDEARAEITEKLGQLGEPFLQRARANGWTVDRLRVENRAVRNGRAFSIVLAPYEHLWTRGREERHPMGALSDQLTQEQYAAESARLMGFLADKLGGPWRAGAPQAGWDLFDRAQQARRRRKNGHVVTQPAPLPPLTGGATVEDLSPELSWSRWTRNRPATATEREWIESCKYAVHLDRANAWLASANKAKLGYLPEGTNMSHVRGDALAELLQRPEAIPAGLYRVRMPAHAHTDIPPLHPGQGPERGLWLWVTAPTVAAALASDAPDANYIGLGATVEELITPQEDEEQQAEAWVFPAQGQLLGGQWGETLRDAVYAAQAGGDETARGLLKAVYSSLLQTSQNTSEKVKKSTRGWHHQATWLATVKAAHYSWQNHLLRKARYAGMAAVAVQIDEVVFLTNNPHTVQLGAAKGLIGQYKRKTVRELTHEHREAIASGYSAIDLKGGEVELGGEEA